MSSAWLLPEHVADVLPAQARHIEELRRRLLDLARSYGCELVMPPLLEHLDALLSGAGNGQELRTFKLIDQLSGRTLGVRADTTPQVARIDAHLLNRKGVTRLCYCGPVLHAQPSGPLASREPLQFGVEIYGHGGLEADLEVQELALDALHAIGLPLPLFDMGDARCLDALLHAAQATSAQRTAILSALAVREPEGLARATAQLAPEWRSALQVLLTLDGGIEVLQEAQAKLPALPGIQAALKDLRWLHDHLQRSHPTLRIGFDLAAVAGNAYYTGVCFTAYGEGQHQWLLRGGRYDEIGAAFGRRRPAVGFSLDLKALAETLPAETLRGAVRAPWGEDAALRAVVRQLRLDGETVVCVLPGHEDEGEEYACDRDLAFDAQTQRWTVKNIEAKPLPKNGYNP